MDLEEAVDLLAVVSDFNFKKPDKRPNFSLFDNQKDGFVLCLKAKLVSEEYRIYLERILKSNNLWMRESEGYLMIKG